MANSAPASVTQKDPLRIAAGVVGGVFLLVGILGFVPGIVTDYGSMTTHGHESNAHLLGLFEVSVLHNIVHLLFGIAGLAMARTRASAKAFLVGGGVVYLALWAYGMVIDQSSALNFVPVNTADNWLHFALGTGMTAAGLILGSRSANTGQPVTRPVRAGV